MGQQGTGFVFDHFTPDGLRWALDYAFRVFEDPAAWKRLMLNGMAQDYSWERQVAPYEELFARLLRG